MVSSSRDWTHGTTEVILCSMAYAFASRVAKGTCQGLLMSKMSLRQLWPRLVRSPPIPFPLPGTQKNDNSQWGRGHGPGSGQWTSSSNDAVSSGLDMKGQAQSSHSPLWGSRMQKKQIKDFQDADTVRSKATGSLVHFLKLWSEKRCLILCTPVFFVGRMTDDGSGIFGGNGETGFPWSGKLFLAWSPSPHRVHFFSRVSWSTSYEFLQWHILKWVFY